MARRLGEQLQDLSSAFPPEPPLAEQPETTPAENIPPALNKQQEAVLLTIKTILALLEKDAVAHATLASTFVANASVGSVLDVLKNSLAAGTVSKELFGPLSQSLVSLARSEALFGNLRHSNASSIQLDLGKRKREQHDDGAQAQAPRPLKKPFLPSPDLYSTVSEAVRIVSHALATPTTIAVDPTLIASIQHPLHHIFLFSVTSSVRGGPEMNPLQEIGGLIQVLGVLTGIQIGQMPDPERESSNTPADIGTAVYPCMTTGCRKMFSRLFSLRGHHRVHSAHRPFRCESCPASFTRNHDLKRHSKMHERKAWKCAGCDKLFSRRDAIRRHKNASQSKDGKQACVEAEIQEVEGDASEDASREEKRARIWTGIVNNEAQAVHPGSGYPDGVIEEGEIPPHIITATQAAVLHLHPILQTYVSNSSGMPITTATPLDPTGGQATLASVIARAQSQSIPLPALPAPLQPNGGLNVSPAIQGLDDSSSVPTLSMYGLSDEQTKLLEEAITNAALAAQAQAEAEAALEEDSDDLLDGEDEDSNMDTDEVEAGSMLPATT
ncbi:hypothetical protein K435DRAFT_683398 [Dendrothele bispora CBS 962.96]|uniref:C2H2-type domain-containing protein n=1 Tax=Dendrothele bispora (strain CBS 962.96) TaxID=1314807 RepID=A0A4S8LCH7_DENBC|nr:hypothetical protein K435DRAFT_683398 [Dendrothele bispora CBS 962.96]